jgi:hypothetical protein
MLRGVSQDGGEFQVCLSRGIADQIADDLAPGVENTKSGRKTHTIVRM